MSTLTLPVLSQVQCRRANVALPHSPSLLDVSYPTSTSRAGDLTDVQHDSFSSIVTTSPALHCTLHAHCTFPHSLHKTSRAIATR